jgi:hypothetical protein
MGKVSTDVPSEFDKIIADIQTYLIDIEYYSEKANTYLEANVGFFEEICLKRQPNLSETVNIKTPKNNRKSSRITAKKTMKRR